MRIESEDDTLLPAFLGDGNQCVQNSLMPAVNPIEGANGHDGGARRQSRAGELRSRHSGAARTL
jgi:hypothetical protein